MRADTILYGGRVLTMDESRPNASTVAITADRIVAVGDHDEVMALAAEDSELIDLMGQTVVPGLIDSHTHLELTAYSRHHWNDVRGLMRAQVVDEVRRRAELTAPGDWIVLQGTFGQDLPDRGELDSAASRHPVAVRWTMHKFQLNSAGLDAAGITSRTVAPPGVRIHFMADGSPTGLVEEGWDLLGWRTPLADELAPHLAETATTLFLRNGVTTIHDIAASPAGVSAYHALADSTEVLPRIGLAFTAAPGHQPMIDVDTLVSTGIGSSFGGPRLSVSAVKIFVDGGRDGALRSTSLDRPATEWGVLTRTPQQLAHEVTTATNAGLQVWIHAIGDLAQEIALSAIEQASRAHPGIDHRCRIEHFGNELYQPERLHRLIQTGGIPAPNPSFIHAEPDDPQRRLPPDIVKYGMRTLAAAGARCPGNSDTAGAQPFACNPWFTMQCMVDRRNRNGVEIDPQESVAVMDALRAFTVDAAYATHHETSRGTVTAGKLADLVILDRDPLTTPGGRLAEVTAVRTMIGGRFAPTVDDQGRLPSPGVRV